MTVQVSSSPDGAKENDQQIMSLLQTAASMWMNNMKKDGAGKPEAPMSKEPADGGAGGSALASKYNKQYGMV